MIINRNLLPGVLILSALPLAAQPAAVNECATLRRHGDAGATACYQKLTRSNDPAVRAEALDAMAILQTIDWMDDKTSTEWIDKVFKINKGYGEAYETAGYFFVINRRYDEGIRYYRKALEIKPDLWSARSQLGVNLMRFGQDQEARALLDE